MITQRFRWSCVMFSRAVLTCCWLASVMLPTMASSACPCANATLCEPIAMGPRKEVFGFTVSGGRHWKHGYDWSQLTTLAWASDPQVMCHAHASGARVVLPATFDVRILSNVTAKKAWIQQQVQKAIDGHLDGTNFDYENAIGVDSTTREQYTNLVAETAIAFQSAIPHSQVTVDVAWSPDDIDGRNYDWVGLAKAADFLFVMSYDTRSQVYGRCIASANSPTDVARRGIGRYLELGIPANKLVLGLPWYGYDYPCANVVDPEVDICPIDAVPFRNVSCSDAAGKEKDYSFVRKVLASSNATTGRRWEPTLETPYFNYRADDGSIHQMWYDDPQSLTIKYSMAKEMGLRGVGFWHIDALDYDGSVSGETGIKQASDMWHAVRAFTGDTHLDALVV